MSANSDISSLQKAVSGDWPNLHPAKYSNRGAAVRSRILIVFGTRPEAIKLCPLVHYFRGHPDLMEARVCVTAQHREMLDQVLDVFHVMPNYDLDLMAPGQDLSSLTARILDRFPAVLRDFRPDVVIVQGDTTTTMTGALAAFYERIPVAHVEAGLRTGDIRAPFPEEMNRVLTTRMAAVHFAPTSQAAQNLLREGIAPERVIVTGNTGIDAVLHVRQELEAMRVRGCGHLPLDSSKRLILLTAHRRENFGEGLENICTAVSMLARRPDIQIAYPVHPNPNVRETVTRRLGGLQSVLLLEPLTYVPFVDLMRRATLILTDSGGVQEEAPSLGKPILVMREKTERPEALAAGTSQLVGTSPERILAAVQTLLDNREAYNRRSQAMNPFGDGHACSRIFDVILSFCGTKHLATFAEERG